MRKFYFSRGKGKRALAVVLALMCILLSLTGLESLADTGGGSIASVDITDKIKVKLDRLLLIDDKGDRKEYIKRGKEKIPYADEELSLGFQLISNFIWEIPDGNRDFIKTGAYFDVPLKDAYLGIVGQKEPFKAYDTSGITKNEIGETEVIEKSGKPFLRATFKLPKKVKIAVWDDYDNYSVKEIEFTDDEGKLVRDLQEGELFSVIEAIGSEAEEPFGKDTLDSSETQDVPSGSETDIPGETGNIDPPNYNPTEDDGMTNQKNIIKKSYSTPNGIAYRIHVNRDQAEKMYGFIGDPASDSSANLNLSSPITPKKDVYVVDELPDGLEIVEGSFGIYVPFFKPGQTRNSSGVLYPNKKTSESFSFSEKVSGNQNVMFEIKKNKYKESWTSFQNRIADSKKPVVGIWEKKKFIAKFMDIPDSERTYSKVKPNLEAEIHKLVGKDISEEQAKYMKAAYLNDNPILSYSIHFDTTKKDPSASIKNKAYYKDTTKGGIVKGKRSYKGNLGGDSRFRMGNYPPPQPPVPPAEPDPQDPPTDPPAPPTPPTDPPASPTPPTNPPAPPTPPSDPSTPPSTPPSDPSTPPSTPPSDPSTPPSTPPSDPSTPPSTPPSDPSTPPSTPPSDPNIPLIPPIEPFEPFVPDVPIVPTPEPPSEIPEIPEVPEEIVPNEPFESLDIELQDEVPRGSTDITEDEKKIPNSSEDIDITEDGPPKGSKKVLAKTGGLYVRLESVLAILMGMMCILWLLRKRRVSK